MQVGEELAGWRREAAVGICKVAWPDPTLLNWQTRCTLS